MSLQDILNAHTSAMNKINQASVDRAIIVGEAQGTIIANKIKEMSDPVGDLITQMQPDLDKLRKSVDAKNPLP